MLIASHGVFNTLEAPFIAASWQTVGDSTFGTSNINSVTSDETGTYLAVGSAGKAAISINSAFTWTAVDPHFDGTNIFAASYGDDIFVVGGSTGKLATSSDGENWTLRNSGFGASPILGITWSDSASMWIAVGGSGKLATSVDAIDWVLRTSSFGATFINDVYSSSALSIAVGYDGKLATSTNGTTWTQRNSSFVASNMYGVTSKPDDSEYVVVGDSGKIATSANGTSWTQVFPNTSFGGSTINSVAANSDGYAAVGSAGKIGTATSSNIWTQRPSGFNLDTINDVYMAENIAIAVGNNGRIAYSI
jgi:hypothetical protein